MQFKKILSLKALIIRCFLTGFVTGVFTHIALSVYNTTSTRPILLLYRFGFILAAYAFALTNIFVPVKKLYAFIYKHRFLLALALFVLATAAKINFSSMQLLDNYIQPGQGNDLISTVFGSSHAIRSDEWAVSTLRTLSFKYSSGAYNDIIMATKTPNLSASGVQWCLGMLASPLKIGFLFGQDFGLSVFWCGGLLLSALAGFELFSLLTNKNIPLSLLGTAFVIFSGFFMWWSFVMPVTYGICATVFVIYLFRADTLLKRCGYGVGTAVFGSAFVAVLYPAWQVPMGYVFLCLIVWGIVREWKRFATFNYKDWTVIALSLVLAVVLIVSYLLSQMEYLTTIMSTVYPGARFETGGMSLYKMFFAPVNINFPLNEDAISTSENGIMYCLFPLPVITGAIVLYKKKFKDLLVWLLLAVSALLTVYCTVGVPHIVAKLTLLSYSTAWRAVDALSLAQAVLLIYSVAELERKDFSLPIVISAVLGVGVAGLNYYFCNKYFPDYMGKILLIAVSVITALLAVAVTYKKGLFKNIVVSAVAVLCIANGCMALPVNVGTNVIYSKPVASEIEKIVSEDEDGIWLAADQWVEANFYAACGARVINSNNYMPNLKMWETLFENGENEEIYNRYANLSVSVYDGPTTVTAVTPDLLQLDLNTKDLKKLKVDYIIVKHEMELENAELLYDEEEIYIYKLK